MGAGGRDPDEVANVLRLVIGEPAEVGRDRATLLETNVDDLDPRLWPDVLAALMAAGASDAWLTPILMKKGRPAHTLSVLCPTAPAADAHAGWSSRQTSTIGLRETTVRKHALDRRETTIEVDGQAIRVKLASLDGTSSTPGRSTTTWSPQPQPWAVRYATSCSPPSPRRNGQTEGMTPPSAVPHRALDLDYPRSLGVYDDYPQAQRAVDFLSDNEFPVSNLAIVGTSSAPSSGSPAGSPAAGSPPPERSPASGSACSSASPSPCSALGPRRLPVHHSAAGRRFRPRLQPARLHRADPRRHPGLLLRQPDRRDEVRGPGRAQAR